MLIGDVKRDGTFQMDRRNVFGDPKQGFTVRRDAFDLPRSLVDSIRELGPANVDLLVTVYGDVNRATVQLEIKRTDTPKETINIAHLEYTPGKHTFRFNPLASGSRYIPVIPQRGGKRVMTVEERQTITSLIAVALDSHARSGDDGWF